MERKVKNILHVFLAFFQCFCYDTPQKWGDTVKSRYWALILGILVGLCLLAGILLWPMEPARTAVITSDGRLIATVDLTQDRVLTVETPDGGSNEITVRDGEIAVTAATCPDGHCMNRGFCHNGLPIVCLPNGLVITFSEASEVDGAVG